MGHFLHGATPGVAYDGCLLHPEEGSVVDRRKRSAGGCGHGRGPVVVEPVPDGRRARCLVCGQSGPARPSSEVALVALRDELRRSFLETA